MAHVLLVMLGMKKLAVLGIALLALAGCTSVDEGVVGAAGQEVNAKVTGVTRAERAKYLASAKIWDAEELAKIDTKDLFAGPGGKNSFQATRNADGSAHFPAITCQFVEPERANELGGKSPKFQCGACADGCTVDKTLKVKFSKDADDNGEVYAEVMTTRLLWALGFQSDDVYPVEVTCKNCPEDPWKIYSDFKPGSGARAERHYKIALIERKNSAPKIEESNWPSDKDGQGFAFDEVEKVRGELPTSGGASNDEWNAFKLLAAFIKHSDNKSANQRLVCDPDAVTTDGKCAAPYLMIQDSGATFGGGGGIFGAVLSGSKARYGKWSDSKIWFSRRECQASLFSAWYSTPTVSEGGRQLLTSILSKITDDHLRAIFTASRIWERGETTKSSGAERAVTVEDWVAAFNAKKAELAAKPCGR